MAKLVLDTPTPAPKVTPATLAAKSTPAALPASSGVQRVGAAAYNALNNGRLTGGPLQPAAAAATPAAAPAANAVQALLSGGVSGGGGASSAGVGGAAAAPSLQDYINSNFLYQQQQGVNNDSLNNFDADTLAQTQETQAQQALKEQQLGQQQNQLGQTNADNLAAHGLLDSGINFQNQDKIDANGNQQKSAIDSLLTNLVSTRAQGRLTQQQANQQALNTVMNQLSQQFAGQQAQAI